MLFWKELTQFLTVDWVSPLTHMTHVLPIRPSMASNAQSYGMSMTLRCHMSAKMFWSPF